MLSPSAALDRRRRVNLNMLLRRFLRRENRAWPSWHGFGHPLGGVPCLVPFRGKGDDDSRADEPELHTGVAAADQPARLGRNDRSVEKKEVWNVNSEEKSDPQNCTDSWCSCRCGVVLSDGNSNGGGYFGSASQSDRSV
jgi:hypothetical protein